MRILKAINNNIVSACDQNGREIIVMGKGLGYRAKEGGDLPDELIEKIFRMDSQNATDKLKALLADLPIEHIQVSDDIIAGARTMLGKQLNENIFITLTDHINFAVLRFRQGMIFRNALLEEVRRFYHEEYLVGEFALDLIERALNIRLPADEAASIALHFVNAEYDTSLSGAVNAARLIQGVLHTVEETLGIRIDEESLYCDRFVTHLKFLAQRIFKAERLDRDDPVFNRMIAQIYPVEHACAETIATYIAQQYSHHVSNEEIAYLTVHLKRICTTETETE